MRHSKSLGHTEAANISTLDFGMHGPSAVQFMKSKTHVVKSNTSEKSSDIIKHQL